MKEGNERASRYRPHALPAEVSCVEAVHMVVVLLFAMIAKAWLSSITNHVEHDDNGKRACEKESPGGVLLRGPTLSKSVAGSIN